MKNFNPHDWARKKEEDPIKFMKETIYEHKQKLILRHASLPLEMRDNNQYADQLLYSDDDENENGLLSFKSLLYLLPL